MASHIISPSYKQPVIDALALQIVIGLMASLILDGGTARRICGIAIVAFWGGVAVLVLRRRHAPSKTDLTLIKFGYFLVVLITGFLLYGLLN